MRHPYACGCTAKSRCPDHRAAPDYGLASSPMALVALTLFVGMIVVWAAILAQAAAE